ncbi:MAG: shikimate dehydrogenase [Desulfohalobiaceae bacterium]|nr:shikimate dehydrogenase [Desulfohalobiaceae bacterium]
MNLSDFSHHPKVEFQTKVFCILSDERVFRSRSPEIFNRVFARMGINALYVPFRVDPGDIAQAVDSLRTLNIAGANITAPFKQAVVPHLDILSEGGQLIGAINTVICKDKVLKGYNTNAIGLMDTLAHLEFELSGKRVLVFGNGGAARSVIFIVNWLQAEQIYISGRNPARTEATARDFGCRSLAFADLLQQHLSVDLVINATSVASPDESPELESLLEKLDLSGARLMLDLNYGRRENIWERSAGKQGIPFQDGARTLAFQARRTFGLWTGMNTLQVQEFLIRNQSEAD